MIYLTGDTHGDALRLVKSNTQHYKFTAADTVIICGDFGLIWSGSRGENQQLDFLASKPFTVLFVDGNHENFDLLAQYPVEQWNGGKVHRIRPNILHLMRGQVFTIAGKTFFTMGGASSHDIDAGILEPNDPHFYEKEKRLRAMRAMYRVNHYSWWKEELPSSEELDEGRTNLDAYGWRVDYIITHCCPTAHRIWCAANSAWRQRATILQMWCAALMQWTQRACAKHWKQCAVRARTSSGACRKHWNAPKVPQRAKPADEVSRCGTTKKSVC